MHERFIWVTLIMYMRVVYLLLMTYCLLFVTPVYAADLQTCDACGGCVGSQLPDDHTECTTCTDRDGYSWTVLGCLPTSPGGFVQSSFRVITSIVGGLAFLALLYGGGLVLTSQGSEERLSAGKSILISAITGVVLTLFAVFILRFIGVEVFKLPGFG